MMIWMPPYSFYIWVVPYTSQSLSHHQGIERLHFSIQSLSSCKLLCSILNQITYKLRESIKMFWLEKQFPFIVLLSARGAQILTSNEN